MDFKTNGTSEYFMFYAICHYVKQNCQIEICIFNNSGLYIKDFDNQTFSLSRFISLTDEEQKYKNKITEQFVCFENCNIIDLRKYILTVPKELLNIQNPEIIVNAWVSKCLSYLDSQIKKSKVKYKLNM